MTLWSVQLRQEIDGPQCEELEFVPYGQILQNSGSERGAESCPDKRKTPHISHSQGQGDLPNCTRTERLLGGQKGSDVNLPISLFARIQSWLRGAHAHMGGPWDKPNMDPEPGKTRCLAKGNLEEINIPCKWFKLPQGRDSLSEFARMSIHMYPFSS